jgi:hypothetical protein
MRFRSAALLLLALLVTASAVYLHHRPRPARTEVEAEPAVVPRPPESPAPTQHPNAPAPAASEVQITLDRVFGGAVRADEGSRPAFVAGDFNGDDVADLAVAVRVRGEEAALRIDRGDTPCGRQDATAPAGEAAGLPATARVAAGDALLAVMHGEGAQAWRGPEPGQCFLVRNATGTGLRRRPLAEMPAAVRLRVTRAHAGDVIALVRAGTTGIVFWTGAAYAWTALDE